MTLYFFTIIFFLIVVTFGISASFAEEVICEDKVWIENYKGKIACVTPSTADKLVERGWGTLLVDEEVPVQLLFVQTANSGSFNGDILTLDDIAAHTIYFSDRPHRIVGHFTTQFFTDSWDEGDDSFALDPPNAAIVLLDDESESIVVVELTNPVYDSEMMTLQYTIQILDDSILPERFDHIVLYIDAFPTQVNDSSFTGLPMDSMIGSPLNAFANMKTPGVYADMASDREEQLKKYRERMCTTPHCK